MTPIWGQRVFGVCWEMTSEVRSSFSVIMKTKFVQWENYKVCSYFVFECSFWRKKLKSWNPVLSEIHQCQNFWEHFWKHLWTCIWILNTLRKQCLEFRGSWEEMYFATTCLLLKWWKWKRYKHKSIRISPQIQVHITNQCISIFWIETRFRKEKYHSFSKRKSSFLLLFPWQLRCSWK